MNLNRRAFAAALLSTISSFSGLAAAFPERKNTSRLRLSLAAYSFRQHFVDTTEEKTAPPRIDLFEFLDFCADHGCDGAELTSYYFPKSPSKDFLLKLKRHAFLRGVEVSGTAVGNKFTLPPGKEREQQIASVKKWIDHAQVLGAPHLRVFAGSVPEGLSADQAKAHCIEALKECCDYAGQRGVMLGIENHGGIVEEAHELLDILKQVNHPWLGINLDTGNFHTADPYGDLEKCAPYAVNVQVKAELRAKGKSKEATDYGRIVQMLRQAKYQGYVTLEYESDPSPFKAIPPLLAELRKLCKES